MRPVTVVQSGTGSTAPVVHDYLVNPSSVAIGTVVSGTANYTVQHTLDDVFAASYVPASGNWYNSNNPRLVSATGNLYDAIGVASNSSLAVPVRASRVTVNSGTGSVTSTFVQATI